MVSRRERIGRRLLTFGYDPRVTLRSVRGWAPHRRNRRAFMQQRRLHPHAADEFPLGLTFPCLADRFDTSGTASGQYFHQDLFVAQEIFASSPRRHVDVGSRVDGFVAHVASFRHIDVIDVRPASTDAANIRFHMADIMQIDESWHESTDSLSCLHSIEHFGLGRYGDPIDVDGWRKGWAGLVRIAEPGARIYLSTVIGPQRIEFDAHRVFDVRTITDLVSIECDIESLAYIDDDGRFHRDADPFTPDSFGCTYGCAIFVLRRR
jgi:hypothetical protein